MHIDWSTLALQTINVLILVWILSRFLFQPVRAIIAKRQEQVDASLADVEKLKQQAAESRAAAETAREAVAAEKDRLIAAAQAEAAKEKARLLDLAKADIEAVRKEAAAADARDKAAMEAALVARLKDLAVEIARRLITRVASDAGLDGFVDGLCAQLKEASAETRAALIWEHAKSKPLEVVTAGPLSTEAKTRLADRLQSVLGKDVVVSFSADPAVIAGIELHGSTMSLSNSLRQDLDHLAKDLNFGV
ncbi:MAG: F0F1 ATP synthase subunit delta [Methylovirgula sp.]